MKEILKYIYAKQFFTDYVKQIKNFRHKMRGFSGNKKPIDFSADEKKMIAAGLKEMTKDIISKLK